MPVRNEGDFISESLSAVLAQDYPADRMEVIVSDGMSTDETRDIVQKFQQSHPHLRLIDNPRGIAPTALNVAVPHCKGEIVVRVDGHCCIERDYVSRCVEHLQQEAVDGVGGPIETIGQSPLAQVIAVAMSSRFGVGGSAFRTVSGRTMLVDTIAFPAYTRRAIQLAGPYDEELVRNQDDEYNYRLRRLGGKLLLAADVRSRYYSRSSLRKLWRQYFQYGYWKVRVMQKHPMQMRLRQFVPVVFVVALLAGITASPFSQMAAIGLSLILLAYAVACVLATVAEKHRLPWHLLVWLPLCFAILHISYGLGFLMGLIRFLPRWLPRRGTGISNEAGLPHAI
jgi:cellulose synthase/poly-beta-1,6-N-acetylglucosamine synthase-like glycosyltransferase